MAGDRTAIATCGEARRKLQTLPRCPLKIGDTNRIKRDPSGPSFRNSGEAGSSQAIPIHQESQALLPDPRHTADQAGLGNKV